MINSRFFYLCVNILMTIFQTGFVISPELNSIYLKQETDHQKREGSILSENSILSEMSKLSNIISITRPLQTSTLTIVLICICTVCTVIILTFLRFDFFNKILKLRLDKKSYFMYFVATIFLNYDLIFFIINVISFNCLPCRIIEVPRMSEIDKNYLEENSLLIISDYDLSLNQTIIYEKVSVVFISNNIKCGTINHWLIGFFGLVLMILNISIKVVSSKMMRYTPSRNIFLSKYGNTDVVYDVVLNIVMGLTSLCQIYFTDNYTVLRILYFVYLSLFLGAYFNNYFYKPFFNKFQHGFKSFQILYMINLTCFSIIVREFNFVLIQTEISTMIIMMISLSIMIRVNLNLSRTDPTTLFSEANNKLTQLSEKRVMEMFYILTGFIEDSIKVELGKHNPIYSKEIVLSIEYLNLQHREICSKMECFCRSDSSLYWHKHRLGIFKRRIKNDELFNLSILLEDLLERTYLSQKGHKNASFYCYLYYLINFMGKPLKAYLTLQERLREQGKEILDDRALSFEEHALLQSIELLFKENLDKGLLSFHAYPQLINESIYDSRKLRITSHINFINFFQKTKSMILHAIYYRKQFLKEICSSGKIENCYEYGVKFYRLTERINSKFEYLLDCSQRRYAPVLLANGLYLKKVYQKTPEGHKFLNEFTRKFGKRNLNKIFSLQEFYKDQFSTIFLKRGEKTTQEISYVHQGLAEYLNFKVSDLEGQNLDLVLPSPIQKFHQKKMKPENMRGRLFMIKELMPTFAINKAGFLMPLEIGLRYNSSILNGPEMVAIINRKITENETSVLILDNNFNICQMSEDLELKFCTGINFVDYSYELSDVRIAFSRVINDKLLLKERKEGFDVEIFKKSKMMEAWKIYLWWQNFQRLEIVDSVGSTCIVSLTIKEQIVWPGGEYYYIVEILKNSGNYELDSVEIQALNQHYSPRKGRQGTENDLNIFEYMINSMKNEHRHKYGGGKDEEESSGSLTPRNDREQIIEGELVGYGADRNKQKVDSNRFSRNNTVQSKQGGSTRSLLEFNMPPVTTTNTTSRKNHKKMGMGANPKNIDTETFEEVDENEEEEEGDDEIVNSDQVTNPKSKNSLHRKHQKLKLQIIQGNCKTSVTNKNSRKMTKGDTRQQPPPPSYLRPYHTKKPLFSSSTFQEGDSSSFSSKNKKTGIIPPLVPSRTPNPNGLHHLANLIAIIPKKIDEHDRSSIASVVLSTFKVESLETVIHENIKPNKIHTTTILVLLLLLSIMGINYTIINIKNPIMVKTRQDLIDQLATADMYSWGIWANLYPVWSLDMLRMIQIGMFDPKLGGPLFNETDSRPRAESSFWDASTYYFLSDKLIIQKIKTLRFPDLYNYEGFIKARGNLSFYRTNHTTGEYYFEDKILARNTIVKILDLQFRTKSEYNFSDPSVFVDIGRNRMLNIEEEFMRRNFWGDIHRIYTNGAYDFYEYLKAVGKQNEDYAVHSLLWGVLVAVILYLVFFCYIMLESSYMRAYYVALFKFQVNFSGIILTFFRLKTYKNTS